MDRRNFLKGMGMVAVSASATGGLVLPVKEVEIITPEKPINTPDFVTQGEYFFEHMRFWQYFRTQRLVRDTFFDNDGISVGDELRGEADIWDLGIMRQLFLTTKTTTSCWVKLTDNEANDAYAARVFIRELSVKQQVGEFGSIEIEGPVTALIRI